MIPVDIRRTRCGGAGGSGWRRRGGGAGLAAAVPPREALAAASGDDLFPLRLRLPSKTSKIILNGALCTHECITVLKYQKTYRIYR